MAICCTGIDTIDGIIEGVVAPENTPFAALSPDEQRSIIAAIDNAAEDIAPIVLQAFPDLDDEKQRASRLRAYKAEFLAQTEAHLRAAYASHFDTLYGVILRDANTAKTYSLDDSGVVEFAA
jgi:hypothetical protein